MNPEQLTNVLAILEAQNVPYQIEGDTITIGVQPPTPRFEAIVFDPDLIQRAAKLLPPQQPERTDRAARRARR